MCWYPDVVWLCRAKHTSERQAAEKRGFKYFPLELEAGPQSIEYIQSNISNKVLT